MKLKNSPGAVSAIGRASGHIAKAMLELRQADREFEQVRGVGRLASFLADCNVYRFLAEMRDRISDLSQRTEGLRLINETPEEGPLQSKLTQFANAIDERGHVDALVTQTHEGPQVHFTAPTPLKKSPFDEGD